jgi:hypothetical protein
MARLWLPNGPVVSTGYATPLQVFADFSVRQGKVRAGEAGVRGVFESDTEVTLTISANTPPATQESTGSSCAWTPAPT